VKLTDLTRHHIDQYYTHLTTKKKLAPMTAKDRMATLKAMQNFAIKRGLMLKSPVDEAMKDLRGIKKPRIQTFNQDQIAAVIRVAATTKPFRGRDYTMAMTECFVHLAAFCGLRYGEIVGLTLANVDLQNRCIRVRHSFCRVSGLKGPKTAAGIRDVPLAPHIAVLIQKWVNRYYEDNALGLLFTNYSCKPICHTDFYVNQWMPLLKRAGLYQEDKPLRFHALRHFAASWMVHNGLPLTDVAKVLGHETFDTTLQIYAHPVSSSSQVRESFDHMAAKMLKTDASAPLGISWQG
jgi:integrase